MPESEETDPKNPKNDQELKTSLNTQKQAHREEHQIFLFPQNLCKRLSATALTFQGEAVLESASSCWKKKEAFRQPHD